MANEYKPTPDEASFVIQRGTRTELPNGTVRHVGRHPQNPDHKLTIVTASLNGKKHIVDSRREHAPMQAEINQAKQRVAAEKARKDRSAKAKSDQLAKKRARTPAPNNKK